MWEQNVIGHVSEHFNETEKRDATWGKQLLQRKVVIFLSLNSSQKMCKYASVCVRQRAIWGHLIGFKLRQGHKLCGRAETWMKKDVNVSCEVSEGALSACADKQTDGRSSLNQSQHKLWLTFTHRWHVVLLPFNTFHFFSSDKILIVAEKTITTVVSPGWIIQS